jgi:hypothetical protein
MGLSRAKVYKFDQTPGSRSGYDFWQSAKRSAVERQRVLAARRLNPTFVPTNSRRASSPISIALSRMLIEFVDPDPVTRRPAVNFLAQEGPGDEDDEEEEDEDDEESGEDDGAFDGYSE